MPTERDFETVLARYPELIEDGLIFLDRQVSVYGRRMDLLFRDRVGRRLIAELKWGPIKDEHIGQIMCYEGMLLSADDPTIRVMLIGTRVPPNLRRTLDHHGIGWREIRPAQISDFLAARGDHGLMGVFPASESVPTWSESVTRTKSSQGRAPILISAPAASTIEVALFVPTEARWLDAAFKYFRPGRDRLYFKSDAPIGKAENLAMKVFFKEKGTNVISAQAALIEVTAEMPPRQYRLPGCESEEGKYYYGFSDLTRMDPLVEMSSFRRYPSGKILRNDSPGACLIQETERWRGLSGH